MCVPVWVVLILASSDISRDYKPCRIHLLDVKFNFHSNHEVYSFHTTTKNVSVTCVLEKLY